MDPSSFRAGTMTLTSSCSDEPSACPLLIPASSDRIDDHRLPSDGSLGSSGVVGGARDGQPSDDARSCALAPGATRPAGPRGAGRTAGAAGAADDRRPEPTVAIDVPRPDDGRNWMRRATTIHAERDG